MNNHESSHGSERSNELDIRAEACRTEFNEFMTGLDQLAQDPTTVIDEIQTPNGKTLPRFNLNGGKFAVLCHVAGLGIKNENQAIAERVKSDISAYDSIEKGRGEGNDSISNSLITQNHIATFGTVGDGKVRLGYSQIAEDGLRYSSSGDSGTRTTGEWTRHQDDTFDSPADILHGDHYNEVVTARYDKDGKPIRPDFLICFDGKMSPAETQAAEYFLVPVVNLNSQTYAEQERDQVSELISQASDDLSARQADITKVQRAYRNMLQWGKYDRNMALDETLAFDNQTIDLIMRHNHQVGEKFASELSNHPSEQTVTEFKQFLKNPIKFEPTAQTPAERMREAPSIRFEQEELNFRQNLFLSQADNLVTHYHDLMPTLDNVNSATEAKELVDKNVLLVKSYGHSADFLNLNDGRSIQATNSPSNEAEATRFAEVRDKLQAVGTAEGAYRNQLVDKLYDLEEAEEVANEQAEQAKIADLRQAAVAATAATKPAESAPDPNTPPPIVDDDFWAYDSPPAPQPLAPSSAPPPPTKKQGWLSRLLTRK